MAALREHRSSKKRSFGLGDTELSRYFWHFTENSSSAWLAWRVSMPSKLYKSGEVAAFFQQRFSEHKPAAEIDMTAMQLA